MRGKIVRREIRIGFLSEEASICGFRGAKATASKIQYWASVGENIHDRWPKAGFLAWIEPLLIRDG